MCKFLMTLIILKAAVIPLKCYFASGSESLLELCTNVNRKSGFSAVHPAVHSNCRVLHHDVMYTVITSRMFCLLFCIVLSAENLICLKCCFSFLEISEGSASKDQGDKHRNWNFLLAQSVAPCRGTKTGAGLLSSLLCKCVWTLCV